MNTVILEKTHLNVASVKKVLITPGELTTHKCSQCGEKSFQCCLCDKAFKTSSDLSTHKHIHNR